MQIYPDKLAGQLKQGLAQAYLIAGDEALLRSDAADAIRAATKQQQYDSVEKHIHDANFEWHSFLDSCNSMSLFAEKRLIELRLNSGKIGAEGSKALVQLLSRFPDDAILLVDAPRIEGKPKWVKVFQDSFAYVPVYPLDDNQLPRWLAQRARQSDISLTQQAAELLAELVSGNLLAAVQEIEKLSLLHGEKTQLDVDAIEDAVASSARFTAFNMLDYAVAGNATLACRALRLLQEEGAEIPAVIGGLAHQLRTLRALKGYEKQGALNQGFKAQRVFNKKQTSIRDALKRLSEDDLRQCVSLASRADIMAKSGKPLESWMAIEMTLLKLAGKTLPTEQLLIDHSDKLLAI